MEKKEYDDIRVAFCYLMSDDTTNGCRFDKRSPDVMHYITTINEHCLQALEKVLNLNITEMGQSPGDSASIVRPKRKAEILSWDENDKKIQTPASGSKPMTISKELRQEIQETIREIEKEIETIKESIKDEATTIQKNLLEALTTKVTALNKQLQSMDDDAQ
jgi:hypothetical protein